MGVSGLASWVRNNIYGRFRQHHNNHSSNNELGVFSSLDILKKYVVTNHKFVDCFAFDANGLIYTLERALFDENIIHDSEKFEEELIKRFLNHLLEIINIFQPNNYVMIVLDGVTGWSKLKQQRSRRFAPKIDDEHKKIFDTLSISVGTKFMENVANGLKEFMPKHISQKLIISTDEESGEGEHKIIRMLDKLLSNNEIKSMCIFSPDGDMYLLLLSLLAKYQQCEPYLMKYDTQIAGRYIFDDMNIFADEILFRLNTQNKLVLADFVSVSSILGDDFIDSPPGYSISRGQSDGMRALIDALKETLIKYDHIVTFVKYKNREIVSFDSKSLLYFTQIMAKTEKEHVIDEMNNMLRMNEQHNGGLEFAVTRDEFNLAKTNFQAFKEYHYNKFSQGETSSQVSKCYLTGMVFVVNYYLINIPSWTWFYQYDYAPFISDIANFLETQENISITFDFTLGKPLNRYEQLFCILPMHANFLLQDNYEKIKNSMYKSSKTKSMMEIIFPQSIVKEERGYPSKKNAIPKLPMITDELITSIRSFFKSKSIQKKK